ncbi:MAG: threonylcarbamoyl-AMP synthase [Acidobacteria bacterium]|jgi:tRNA threonylcarbamoyl adenosine modification protein (Sua5/YciO/YrdC/YwlC family)|nr:threonylcarbamoyl-AMP synthase [Acidobacteriota bacterium]
MSRRLTVEAARRALSEGRVVALPTDTVYGLAARWDDAEAVSTIFELKSRPRDVALPVLVATSDQITALGVEWPERARRLAERWWPGALTVAVPVVAELAQRIGAEGSIGFRQPAAPITLDLLALSGPLAVTSANRHGHEPARSAEEVLATFAGTRLAGVLDGGRCDAVVSTVIELVGESWRLRRAGGVDVEQVAEILGPPLLDGDR